VCTANFSLILTKVSPMVRQEARYRGYKISREYRFGQWQLGVEPSRSDLPITCEHYFITEVETWTEALAEAKRLIDRLLLR
jgi:hypothetical protein